MSTIRLDDVTKVFTTSKLISMVAVNKPFSHVQKQADQAFAQRVDAQMVKERAHPKGGGDVFALSHVNLTIPDGQTLAVVGPSGCGKSTLLRVVCGLEPDHSGRVFYDDQDMADIAPKDRFIGMVFQNYALYPHFKSKGNLGFFFKMHSKPDKEAEERIRITSEMMGIGFDDLLKRKPGTLSGGQQQRVAIARAIVRTPRLFLFDEPLSNLDAKLRVQTRVEIKRLLHRFKITAIYVTHDQIEAITLGDRIAVMREGRIEQVGTFQELTQSPVNSFVAGFIGSPPMNLFSGGIVGDGVLLLDDLTIPLPNTIKPLVHASQQVVLGVRPEAATLVLEDRPLPESVRVKSVIETVEPDFARRTQLAYVRAGEHFFAARGTSDILLNVGDEIDVAFPVDQLYFFDKENGERITSRTTESPT